MRHGLAPFTSTNFNPREQIELDFEQPKTDALFIEFRRVFGSPFDLESESPREHRAGLDSHPRATHCGTF
jgi:hypothetical protein